MSSSRRGNRESWVPDQPNAKGYWEASVWMGTKANGAPDRRHVQRKTRAGRNKAVRELERKRNAGVTGKGGKRTVEQMLTRHLGVVLPQRGSAPRTIDDYWSKCRNDIFPRWGGQRLEALLPEHIEDGFAEMLRDGHAPSHVRKVHAILSSAYEIEVQRGNVARNPCKLARPPKGSAPEKTALTQDDARRILAAIEGQRNSARWKVGLACGLRQGEVLGLRWPFVDLARGELKVWWQLQRLPWRHGCGERRCKGKRGADCPQRHGGGLVFRETKEKRHKTLPVGPLLAAFLKAHRAEQAAERLHAGELWTDHGLVFAQADGMPIDPRRDWEEWKTILAAAGIAHVGVHGMRHSAATYALEQGVAMRTVQELLGHSNLEVTQGYMHVSGPLAKQAADVIDQSLFRPGK